ncbi:hypothetical protein HNQ59_002877 [Chitinivorax tropicus]|uniref:Heparinase II N-terminal domain-containing protein n=1 Tax=Chitinivorax tropicus TaxID=714531 RepID=A0A840MQ55_9PROT|nr:DUF4962 domain-containing protein [Chitinivorax tropicus]MBB5019575.1 hypothetical protein [Chitinivorax tropicus]
MMISIRFPLVKTALLGLVALPVAFAADFSPSVTTSWIKPNRAPSTDWLGRAGVLDMPIIPADGALVKQNPVYLSWPAAPGAAGYNLVVQPLSGAEQAHDAAYNWFPLPKELARGTYQWRIRAKKANGQFDVWSDWRTFTVTGGGGNADVSNIDGVYNQLKASPHPRTFPKGAELTAIKNALTGIRKDAYNKLKARTKVFAARAQVDEVKSVAASADMSQRDAAVEMLAIMRDLKPELDHIMEQALIWRIDRNEAALNDAKARALKLASWDPDGPSAYEPSHHMPRNILWSLAIAYDWLYDGLTTDERAKLRDVISKRLTQIELSLMGSSKRMMVRPFDSHGWLGLNAMAAIVSIIGGEVPNSEALFKLYVPWAMAVMSPWGGEDGGFSQGTGYGSWHFDPNLHYWDAIRRATGIDPYQKVWLKNTGNFLLYFAPPGSPSGGFGEGADAVPDASFIVPYTMRVPSQLYRWHGANQKSTDPSSLLQLLAPVDTGDVTFPKGIPDAAVFPSIGWAAVHSSLSDPKRFSLYFKSSAFGSFNHSHADQNSFIINYEGKKMALDSGFYDWYGSPHHSKWYQQTLAHNAITFDGGKGQLTGQMDARGEITRFSHMTGYTVMTGDATRAYGGALLLAQRSMTYLKPGFVLVYDALSSDTPRQWEWNLHTMKTMEVISPKQIKVAEGSTVMCVDQLSDDELTFSQTDRFTVDPDPSKRFWSNQWHGRFSSKEKSKKSQILMLLRMGCAEAADMTVNRLDEGYVVNIAGKRIAMQPGRPVDVK